MLSVKCCASPPPRDVIKRIRRREESKRIEYVKALQEILKKTANDELKFIKSFFPEKRTEKMKVEIMDEDEEDDF